MPGSGRERYAGHGRDYVAVLHGAHGALARGDGELGGAMGSAFFRRCLWYLWCLAGKCI